MTFGINKNNINIFNFIEFKTLMIGYYCNNFIEFDAVFEN